MKYLFTVTCLIFVASITYAQEAVIIGPGRPPAGYKFNWKRNDREILRKARQTAGKLGKDESDVKILDVPVYDWTYGCSPTSAGMLIAYYDRNGYPNLYTGDDNYGVAPITNEIWDKDTETPGSGECPFIASEVHLKDFWLKSGSGKDPFFDSETETRNWTPHWEPLNTGWDTGDCLADFMGTSQGYIAGYNSTGSLHKYLGNSDGGSILHLTWDNSSVPYKSDKFGDLTYGCVKFIQSKSYTVDNWFNQMIYPLDYDTGFTFEQYCAEIDAGRPVLIIITGHNILGIGYNKSEKKIYLHNTWDFSTDECDWAGEYRDRQMCYVGVIQLGAPIDTTTEVTVTSSSDTAGTVYPSGTVYCEDTQKIKAVSKYGYDFSYWESVNGNVVFADAGSPETMLTISGEDTVTAIFNEQTRYKVTFKVPEGYGGIAYYDEAYDYWNEADGNEYMQEVYAGEDCKPVRVTQSYADYPLQMWEGDISSTDNPITITNVTQDITITALYGTTYTVSATASPGGSVDKISTTVMEGNPVTITAVPVTGYEFTGWTGDIISSDNPLTIENIKQNYSIFANFEAITCTVSISISGEGSISQPENQTVNYGSSMTITAIPDQYYKFIDWTGDLTSTDNPLTVNNIQEDISITVNFEVDSTQIVQDTVTDAKITLRINTTTGKTDTAKITATCIDPTTANIKLLIDNAEININSEEWKTTKNSVKYISTDKSVKANWKNNLLFMTAKTDIEPLSADSEVTLLALPYSYALSTENAVNRIVWKFKGNTDDTVKVFRAKYNSRKELTIINMTGNYTLDENTRKIKIKFGDYEFQLNLVEEKSNEKRKEFRDDNNTRFIIKSDGKYSFRAKSQGMILPATDEIIININNTSETISPIIRQKLQKRK